MLLSRQPVWDDDLMVEVKSRADVAAGQHDFRSQVAAVILGSGGGEGGRVRTGPSGQMKASYNLGP